MPTPHKIRVEFSDKNTKIEPPDGQEIADAIRAELESLLHPISGNVTLWHGNYPGWEPLQGGCWVHFEGRASVNVEEQVRLVLERRETPECSAESRRVEPSKRTRRVGMMRRARKERLEKRGWRFGTTQEFLGLSPEETAEVEARLRLVDSRSRRAREGSRRAGVGSRRV